MGRKSDSVPVERGDREMGIVVRSRKGDRRMERSGKSGRCDRGMVRSVRSEGDRVRRGNIKGLRLRLHLHEVRQREIEGNCGFFRVENLF